jgi:hypothetical protein
MTPALRAAALDLMTTVLSPMGYEKVNRIRLADDDFKANDSKRGPHGGGPPGGVAVLLLPVRVALRSVAREARRSG